MGQHFIFARLPGHDEHHRRAGLLGQEGENAYRRPALVAPEGDGSVGTVAEGEEPGGGGVVHPTIIAQMSYFASELGVYS